MEVLIVLVEYQKSVWLRGAGGGLNGPKNLPDSDGTKGGDRGDPDKRRYGNEGGGEDGGREISLLFVIFWFWSIFQFFLILF